MSAELDRERRVLPLPGEAAIGARPDDLLAERRHPRGTGLIAQQTIDPFLGEAFLPAPQTQVVDQGTPRSS